MDAKVEQKLAAIMAADVVGYSALMGDDERATVVTLDEYRAVFRDHVGGQGGRVVDTAGGQRPEIQPRRVRRRTGRGRADRRSAA